jgi:putative ABC transport system ATP-binding protein
MKNKPFSSTSNHPALITLRQVSKTYTSAQRQFDALRSVGLSVKRGEFLAIIGKSGSGKSTLLNLISGIDRPSAGEVWVGETAVHTLSESQMAVWRGKNVGVVFQFFQLLPTLTILENVMLPMDLIGQLPSRQRKERAQALLAQVDLADQAHKLPAALSGGQQQRAAIARALANDPALIVADEPTGNLDSQTAEAVFDLFGELVRSGKTVVMVTHDRDIAQRASRVVSIVDGQIHSDTANLEAAHV